MPKISKKASSVNRSRAAKKGWETRRANAAKRDDSAPKERAKQTGNKRGASKSADKLARDAAKLKRERANLEAAKKAFRAEQKRERASLRKAETKESRALKKAETLEKAAAKKTELAIKKLEAALSDMKSVEDIVTNMAQKGVPVSAILGPFEDNPEATQRIKELIVQARLDMSAAAYNDVRWDAFDLAEELDWDISDVYDAWNYDEPSA